MLVSVLKISDTIYRSRLTLLEMLRDRDFDTKNYVLMSQETTSSLYSGALQDIKEYVFKTTDEKITYSSGNADYDKFKTFSIKVALTSDTASTVPRVRDMRAIALDT